ncbi:MAG: hypothetical protein NUV54_02035 [Candidatus Taylorbacteria bacterium]|nr:hypothetical protein [Candidatus Taylorbacteria bacterium]
MPKNINWLILSTFFLLALFFLRVNNQMLSDTWWHMSVGREVQETKKIPTSDSFVYGSKNTNYTSTEWLSGLIFFEIYSKVGVLGLSFFKMIVTVLAAFFLYKTLTLFIKEKYKIVFALILTSYLLSFRLSLRPEMFTLLFLSVTNYICLRYYYHKELSRFLYTLPFIFLVWPNLHGFVPAGLILLTFFAFISIYEWKILKVERKHLSQFLIIFLLTLAAGAVQLNRLLFFVAANQFSPYITEWANLKDALLGKADQAFHWEIVIYILILTAYTFAFLKTKKTWINTFYFVVLLFPIKFYRLVAPVALLTVPQLGYMLEKGNFVKPLFYKILFFAGLLVIVITIFIGSAQQTWPPPIPERAEKYIRDNLVTKRLFTLGIWSDYFIWNIKGIKTFSDVMNQYRDNESLYAEKSLVIPDNNPQELLKKYDIDTVVNTQVGYNWASSTKVAGLPGWKLVYLSESVIIYARNDVIVKSPIDLSVIDPYLNYDFKFQIKDREIAVKQLENLLIYDPLNAFARNQLILNDIYENRFDEARKLALESRQLIPNNSYYSFLLAVIYANQNDCQKSYQFAKEATAKSPDTTNKSILENLLREKCSLQI